MFPATPISSFCVCVVCLKIYLSFLYTQSILAKEKAAQDKAAKEEAEEEAEANKKRHLNVVFIGHVGMAIYFLISFHQFYLHEAYVTQL